MAENKVMVTYDVSGKQTPVKDAMKKKKYLDYWTDGDETRYLPATTLWKKKEGLTPEQVMTDLKNSVDEVNNARKAGEKKIVLERAKAVLYTDHDSIPGQPYEDE